MVWEASPGYMFLAILLQVVSSAIPPVQIWTSKVIIDRVSEALQSQVTAFDWYSVFVPIGIIFGVWAIGGACRTLSANANMLASMQFRNYADFLILKKATELDVAFYETPAFYDKMENALGNVGRAHDLVYNSLSFLRILLTLGAVLALLLQLHPLAIVVLLLTSAPHTIIRAYFAKQYYVMESSRMPAIRMARYLAGLLKSRDAVKEIRLFNLDGPFLERFRRLYQQYFSAERRVRLSISRRNAVLGLASSAGTAGIWAYAVAQAIGRRITLGDVALVFQASEQGRNELGSFFQIAGSLYENTLFAENLLSFLDLPPDSIEGALSRKAQSQVPALLVPRPIQEGIEFRNVSFHYWTLAKK